MDHTRPAMVEGLEDRIPGAWLGPMLDASKGEGEGLTRCITMIQGTNTFTDMQGIIIITMIVIIMLIITTPTRRGIIAMKKDGLQGSFTDFNVWSSMAVDQMETFTLY